MRTLPRARTQLICRNSWRAIVGLACMYAMLASTASAVTSTPRVSIRVLLLQNLPTLPLSVPPDYSIVTQPAGLISPDADHWRPLGVQAGSRGIRLPAVGVEVDELRLVPRNKEAVIYAASKLYRGGLEVKWRAEGLLVVNTLDVEEYLYGVVPKEAPSRWEMAALRAQAIAARTYALYKRARQTNRDYDVAAHYIRDQHYEGFGAEHPRTTQAVNDTRGLVLTCRGELIPAYYHAESAGHTENSEHVWSSPHPCLRAVQAQMYPASPYLHWSTTLSLQEIRAALAKHGYTLGAIRHLEPVQHSPTGRITLLKVSYKGGQTLMRGTDFRLALGPEVIRSTRFTVQVRNGRAVFSGQGWGHGVGLCQWCSQGMAEQGYDHEAILTHYYQGAKLTPYR